MELTFGFKCFSVNNNNNFKLFTYDNVNKQEIKLPDVDIKEIKFDHFDIYILCDNEVYYINYNYNFHKLPHNLKDIVTIDDILYYHVGININNEIIFYNNIYGDINNFDNSGKFGKQIFNYKEDIYYIGMDDYLYQFTNLINFSIILKHDIKIKNFCVSHANNVLIQNIENELLYFDQNNVLKKFNTDLIFETIECGPQYYVGTTSEDKIFVWDKNGKFEEINEDKKLNYLRPIPREDNCEQNIIVRNKLKFLEPATRFQF